MTYTPVTVSLNSFLFDGATQSPSGVVWDWQELSGWFDTGDLRFATGEAGRGVIVTVDRRIGRPITATVLAHSSSPGMRLDNLMYTAQKALKRAAAPGVEASVTLKVNEPDVALQARVRQAGPIRARMLGTRAMVQFQVPLLAPDYRRYGQTLHTQALTVGSNTVANLGDLPTPVVITRNAGATTNPSWQNTTASGSPTLLYTGSFSTALEIDTDRESVTLASVNVRSALTTAQWWNLASGNNTIVASHASTIEWRDAYS